MKILSATLDGLLVIEPECHIDNRGYFARTYSSREFIALGLEGNLSETSVSFNNMRGTLRGMHYQYFPDEEAKLVRVTTGAAFDVAVDLRPESPTYLKWFGVELSAQNHLAIYIPKGFAHGFITLEDSTEVLYQITDTYNPERTTGFAWNDPEVAIAWPIAPAVMSESDWSHANFTT
jgi:dTDP-4-dehydrorhamnose 3,5-epimerase